MKTISIAFAALAAFGAAVPAVAGPDFQFIEAARKAKQVERAAAAANAGARPASSAVSMQVALPLDHGPRAVTTPYVNEQRKARLAQS